MKCGYRLCPRCDTIPRIRIFFNLQLFFFFLRIRFPFTRIRWIRPAYESSTFLIRSGQSGNFLIRSESGNLWTLDPEFFSRWRNKIEPSSLPSSLPWKAEQDSNFAHFTTHALLPIFPEESSESVWIRIPVDVEFFLIRIKKVVDSKIPGNPEFLHFLLSSTLLRGVEVWSSLTK